jgi:hypothetical protein
MIHEKTSRKKSHDTVPFQENIRALKNEDITSQNFVKILKILSLETIPLKSRVNVLL